MFEDILTTEELFQLEWRDRSTFIMAIIPHAPPMVWEYYLSGMSLEDQQELFQPEQLFTCYSAPGYTPDVADGAAPFFIEMRRLLKPRERVPTIEFIGKLDREGFDRAFLSKTVDTSRRFLLEAGAYLRKTPYEVRCILEEIK